VVNQEGSQGPGGGKAGATLLLAWLAAVLGVPSAVAAFKWQVIVAHPVLGVLLLLLALVLAATGGLVRELWRSKYNGRVVNWISAGLDRQVSRFGKHYRAHLLEDLRYVDLGGLAGRFYTPELSEVYVDVALRPRDPGKVPSSDLIAADLADLPGVGQRRLLSDFLGNPQPRILAVIGAPGSGKTTLLRHTARELCLRGRGHGRAIPIVLYLRDQAKAIVADPKVVLPALIGTVLDRYGLVEPPGWLDGRLRAGDCVVLLDGLDEVPCQEDRLTVSEWVSVQVLRYPGNDFVVTSRPLGYQSAPVETAITLQTQPFTDEQVSRFVHAWYVAVERHSTGAAGPDIMRRADEEADDLLARLRESAVLRDLTVNPLLLTLIATVHRHHGALPGSRAELYAQICQVLVWRRQTAKKLAVEPRGPQKERIMRLLAFEMMSRKVSDLSTAKATAIVRPALRRIAKDLTVTAAEFLDDAASSGLFIERENGIHAFAHLTFQEYLAAAHVKDKNLQNVLAQAVGDTWWRETILLYVAGGDAGPIVQACLAADTVPALALAFDCAEEAGELAEDLRDQLEDIRAAGLSSDADPKRRRLTTGVTITRQLSRIIYGESGARICSLPVPASIYQYFLQDMASQGQYRPPDAPPGTGGHIAIGMRGSDAAAFADWANDITGGQLSYRLPTRSEIQDPVIRYAFTEQLNILTHSIWLDPGEPGKPPQLLPPRDTAFPWTISGTQVQQQSRADFRSTLLTCSLLPLLTRVNTSGNNTYVHLFTDILALAHDHASVLIPALDIAIDLACDPDIGLDQAQAQADDLDRVHELARALDRALDRTLDIDRFLELDQARIRAGALADTLAATGDRGRALAPYRGPARDHDLAFLKALASVDASSTYLGHALSRTLAAVFSDTNASRVSAPQVREIFASKLCDASGIGTGEYVVLPDLLAGSVNSALSAAKTRLVGSDRSQAGWAIQASTNFESLAERIRTRKQPVTAHIASACRIMALCLAAEADYLRASDLSGTFRQIAAGITLLERRHNGDDPSSEIIVLALN
jgi:hypothetical protein